MKNVKSQFIIALSDKKVCCLPSAAALHAFNNVLTCKIKVAGGKVDRHVTRIRIIRCVYT